MILEHQSDWIFNRPLSGWEISYSTFGTTRQTYQTLSFICICICICIWNRPNRFWKTSHLLLPQHLFVVSFICIFYLHLVFVFVFVFAFVFVTTRLQLTHLFKVNMLQPQCCPVCPSCQFNFQPPTFVFVIIC